MPRILLCPADSNRLRSFEVEGVRIDVCSECLRGWFDFGEYQELLPEAARAIRGAGVGLETKLACPECMTYLVKIGSPWRGHVACPSCRGVLLQLPPRLVMRRRDGRPRVLVGLIAFAADLLRVSDSL